MNANTSAKANSPFSQDFYQSIKNELFNDILPYWEAHARDTRSGKEGFFGAIDNENNPDQQIERSIVMTSRFLWTYSAVARLTHDARYLPMADFAYQTITQKYWDRENGGVYWSVLPDGSPKVSKKQIYGEAFCCYGLSEYAAAVKELREEGEVSPLLQPASQSSATPSNGGQAPRSAPLSEEAANLALDLFNLLETHALDPEAGGYVEARARDWSQTNDMILSPKDMNCPKSMNTNLHVMEAYTNLYRTLPVVFPDAKAIRAEVGDSLADLVRITVDKILQPNAHLGMFFDMNWNLLAEEISYGHDIEASWLLWEAACELEDEELKSEIRDTVIRVAQVALDEGFDHENGCMENFLLPPNRRDRTRVWWNQAESINGFYNAWEMTGESKYSDAVIKNWKWIQDYQIDKKGGEWWNAVAPDGTPLLNEDKGGNWKTSYHNGRTCIELLRRSETL
ncbi:MAG: AGE family epimerase/isomerase [Treponema sp.]|nr:AGE family epimerase/isomerase [Treponema sp.]